jgi:signal transduction histidine kinase
VVHGIVVQHGGRITVASHVGEGTRFDVWLSALSGEEETRELETATLAI